MANSGGPVKFPDKAKTDGEKRAGLLAAVYVLSVCIIFTAAGKFLYDETLENAGIENAVVNRQAAAALDIFFSNIHYASFALLETAGAADSGGGPALLFFENNPYTAAVALYDNARPERSEYTTFINDKFFSDNNVKPDLIDIFTEMHTDALNAAQNGSKTVLNGESIFGFPLLVMVFPYRGRAALVFFYPMLESISETGPRITYCVDMEGGALLHYEYGLRHDNLSKHYFIKNMLLGAQDSGRQTYVSGGLRMLGAYTKLKSVPAMLVTEMSYSEALSGLMFAAKRAAIIAAAVIFFLALMLISFTKSINISLKNPKLSDGVKHELETVSRFADMRLARQSLEGILPAEAGYKKATVLLSEIEAFNSTAEHLEPTEALALINDYAGRADLCVKKTNGSLEQLPDGALMAHWGSLSTSGNAGHDALNAVRCALMMRVSMYELNKAREAAGKPCLKFFCGISSGEFIDGIADCDERSRHVLIGEAMIIADIAKARNIVFDTDILMSESAQRLTQKYIVVQEMPPLQIEGRLKPLRIFALINLKTRPGETQVFPATLEDVRSLYSRN
ncbi:MAG: adenylate/guanylate cyclase domain-containing protein [Spirochaetaceae bacterium]|jgi:adenylate cyclase|nr:adenylate/guanylate cyclase domain-containing protein [Spirochaetaceae bacterium]